LIARRPFKGFRAKITSVALSPDGSSAVVCGGAHVVRDDRAARVYSTPSGRLLRQLGPKGWGVSCVAYSPDGDVIATGGGLTIRGRRYSYDNHIAIWDAGTGRQLRRFGEGLSSVAALAFSPDGTYLASGGTSWAQPGPDRDKHCLRLWDWRSGEEAQQLGFHPRSVSSVAFSPDGKIIASGAVSWQIDDHAPKGTPTLRMYDVDTGAELR
jgi:dipeptidyl aminopeptidase/acylaminoacyl peptidase